METEINIKDLLLIIKRNIKTIAAIGILCAIVAFIFSSFIMTPMYSSYVELYVSNTNNNQSNNVNVNDINASQKLVNTYMVILQTDEIMTALLSEIKVSDTYTTEQILNFLEFTNVNNTEVMRITATTPDPLLSANICNGYAALAPTVIENVIKGGSVTILSYAKVSEEPSEPSVTKLTALGLIAGIFCSAAFFIFLHFIDNTVKNEKDVTQRCNIPVVGTIPDFFSIKDLKIPAELKRANAKLNRGKNSSNQKMITEYTLLNRNSPFAVTESYNMIRTNLMFSMASAKRGAIIISSGSPNELKSTTTVNLAVSTAMTGARVLLVDADLRNATIHKILRKVNKRGLSRVLAGLDNLEDAIIPNAIMGVDFLPAGPTPPNPSELLGSATTEDLFKQLDDMYDFIFIDSPPVNLVADAMLLAADAAGVLLVARQNKTKYPELERSIQSIKTAKANLMGLILTDVKPGDSSYGDYGYGYGYGEKKTN